MRAAVGVMGLALMLATGCSDDKDKTPPPSPRVDPVDAIVADAQIAITGSAEFGAKIEITGAAATDPANVSADRFDASFRVLVTLNTDAVNELRIVARDAAGNASEPTLVSVTQETGHDKPAKLTLDLYRNDEQTALADPISIAAGDSLRAVTQVQDLHGHILDQAIALSTDIPNAFVVGRDISHIERAGDFSVAATVAGTSFSLTRNATVIPGKATEVELAATPTSVTAGTAIQISAIARDAFGNVLPDQQITFTSSPALTPMFTGTCSQQTRAQGFLDAHRFVAYDLSQAKELGNAFTLTAAAGDVSASTAVTVKPGPAARFAPADPADCAQGDLFEFTDATWTNAVAEPMDIGAGDPIYYRYGVIDAYGNDTTGPVNVVTSAPGATVIDDGVSGKGQVVHLASSGLFDLSAYVAGVSTPVVKSFTVEVGAANSASIYLSSTLVSPGDEVTAFATVRDAYGNALGCPSGAVDPLVLDIVSSPSSNASAGAVTCSSGLFSRTFTFSENATYNIAVDYQVGTPVSASAYVTVLGLDATPPTVAIADLLIDGTPCVPSGTPPTCAVRRGSTVEFDLQGDDNVALSELQYSAFFETTGTLRTRNVLLSSNTALPASVHFSFTVPGSALPESVPLVGLAIDGAGNRATSDELLLQVGVYTTFGRAQSVVASGGTINGPTDIAFTAAGDLIIANDGDQDLLKIAHGTSTPVVFSSYNRNARYIVLDSADNIYVTETTRINRISADGSTIATYLSTAGGSAQGLGLIAPSVAKGTIDASAASDGATVTVGTQVFELDVNSDGCVGGRVCVVAGANKNQSLAAAIQASSSVVTATYDATAAKIAVAAKTAGEAGDTIALGASGMTVSGATLTQGHAEELVFGQTIDNNVYRLPETLTPTASVASNHGSFSVGTSQRAVALKDATAPSSAKLRDLYVYAVDNGNPNTLLAYHAVDSGAPSSVFSLSSGGGQSFQSLYDVVLQPTTPVPATNPVNGCLLVSDSQNGAIYSVDTRDPSATSPTVTLVASGFSDPRGLAFYNGDLYIADRSSDAIIRLSPSSSSSDCF